MLEDFLSESDLTGVLEFQALCVSGQLYQEISREVFGLEYENENKRRVKDLFFTLFFTKPRNNKNGIPAFKTKYPAVHQIISKIKSLFNISELTSNSFVKFGAEYFMMFLLLLLQE